jgi:hypothetical protein
MSRESVEPFIVRVNAEGFVPKAWTYWAHYSSDALAHVLDLLDMAQPRIWITSKPATPDEVIENPIIDETNCVLTPFPQRPLHSAPERA